MTQMCQLVTQFIHHIYPKHVLPICFTISLSLDLVQAQQPLAELGGWPAGAFTLLGGVWLCIRCLSEQKYDVLPTILFARFLHKVPFLRGLLRSNEQFGNLTKEVILTSIKYSKSCVIQEWDALIVISKPVDVRFHSGSFVFRQTELRKEHQLRESERDPEVVSADDPNAEGNAFEVEVITKVDMDKFDRVAELLLQRLEHLPPNGKDVPLVGKLLRLWRGLQIYQQYPQQTRWDPPLERATGKSYGHSEIDNRVESYLKLMSAYPEQISTEIDYPTETPRMQIHYPDAHYAENELPVGATAKESAVSADEISLLLAFTEYVCGDRNRAINPLILCIWLWMKGKLHPSDNLLIKLPPSTQFIYPQPDLTPKALLSEPQNQTHPSPPEVKSPEVTTQPAAESPPPVKSALPTPSEEPLVLSRAPNILDLSGEDWEVDGDTFLNVWKVIWVLSLLSSALIAFFVILSGGGNPNMATTLGLLFCRPYSIDSNPQDSGYPPSWNGRRRLRWGSGYSCGVFKGTFYKRMGPTGNSLFRATTVHAVSWVTWIWRKQLQTSLNFTQSKPSSIWVLWVAVVLECMATAACFYGTFFLMNLRQRKAAFVCGLNFVCVSVMCVLMFRYLISDVGHETVFWCSEMGIAIAIFYPAVIHRGIGPSHGPFVWYTAIVWIHIIASSCFSR
jgi:hypothetical protein